MKVFYILIMISLVGFGIGVVDVYKQDKPKQSQTVTISKLKLPFSSFIAANAVVEPKSKIISVGATVSGVISKVYIKNGEKIKKGELLFSLDDRVVKNKIALLKTQKIIIVTKIKKAKDELKLTQNLKKISPNLVINQTLVLKKDNLEVLKARLKSLEEKLKITKKEFSLYQVFSPLNGIVLKSNLTIGTYFNKQSQNNMLLIGSNKLNLKVSINEYDLWRFKPNTKAVAFIRTNPKLRYDLKYLYTVSYVEPKNVFSDNNIQRLDTKVLNVIYELPKKSSSSLYVGQQLDVFIKTDR